MTANPHERAVIEAARHFIWVNPYNIIQSEGSAEDLQKAVAALDTHEASLAPGVIEGLDWHLVVEGDELRGNNGKFYPVVRTLKVQRGKVEIVVRLGQQEKILTRPTESDPTATVRRGPTGQAVDTLVHVFSSNAGPRRS